MDPTAFSVIPSCRRVVVGLSPLTGSARVVCASWMEPVHPAVAADAALLGVLGVFVFSSSLVSFATAATAGAAATTLRTVFFVGHSFCELGNLAQQHGLDLCGHCICQHHHVVRMLPACSSWSTAACTMPTMYWRSSLLQSALAA